MSALCMWPGCYGRRADWNPFALCSDCRKPGITTFVLGLCVVLIGLPLFFYQTIIKNSEATTMELFWNVMWALLWIAVFGGILTGIGLFGYHRLMTFLKRKSIKDGWKAKEIEAEGQHKHEILVEKLRLDTENAKKQLTAGPASGNYVDGQWRGEPLASDDSEGEVIEALPA